MCEGRPGSKPPPCTAMREAGRKEGGEKGRRESGKEGRREGIAMGRVGILTHSDGPLRTGPSGKDENYIFAIP